jgi:CRISPR system Cascade subunit CasD
VLGLVAAALGIVRDDEAGHAALEESFGYAARVDAPGRPFLDYHTAQVPPQRRGRRFATRRQELAVDDLETILSQREYRTDALFTAAVWPRKDGPYSLEAIASALKSPRFTLYLGRKAAPLGLPTYPVIVEATSLPDAFSQRPPLPEPELLRLDLVERPLVAFDLDAPGDMATGARIERRRDAVASRRRWQFAVREEGVAVLGPAEDSA